MALLALATSLRLSLAWVYSRLGRIHGLWGDKETGLWREQGFGGSGLWVCW